MAAALPIQELVQPQPEPVQDDPPSQPVQDEVCDTAIADILPSTSSPSTPPSNDFQSIPTDAPVSPATDANDPSKAVESAEVNTDPFTLSPEAPAEPTSPERPARVNATTLLQTPAAPGFDKLITFRPPREPRTSDDVTDEDWALSGTPDSSGNRLAFTPDAVNAKLARRAEIASRLSVVPEASRESLDSATNVLNFPSEDEEDSKKRERISTGSNQPATKAVRRGSDLSPDSSDDPIECSVAGLGSILYDDEENAHGRSLCLLQLTPTGENVESILCKDTSLEIPDDNAVESEECGVVARVTALAPLDF